MTPSSSKVIVVHVGHVTDTKATDVASAKTSDVIPANSSDVITAKSTDVTSTKTAHVGSAKATHVASAKAAHVASAKAAHVTPATTTVASASAAAAAGLCTRGNKAAGKQCTCQNHHRSSSHNILHLDGRTFRHRALTDVDAVQQSKRQRRDELERGMAVRPLH